MGEARGSRRWLLVVGIVLVLAAAFAVRWFFPGKPQSRWNAALVAAARSGDTGAVAAALDAGADVNARDADGITPLMHAARGDRPEIANPGPSDHPEVVELLIKRGADVNAKTESGFVALFWAVRYGHDKVAQVLIDHGADVNAKDASGITPLHWATTNQQKKVIELLKAAGANE
jgi:ankyrin repeat protein